MTAKALIYSSMVERDGGVQGFLRPLYILIAE